MINQQQKLDPQTEILAFVVKNIDKLSRMSLRELKNFVASIKRDHPDQDKLIRLLKDYIKQKKMSL